MIFARGEYIGRGREAVLMIQDEAELPRQEEMTPDRLLLLRDALMEMCSARLTQKQIAFVFKVHPESVGRILRNAPSGLAERAHAILQGPVRPTRRSAG